MTKYKWKKLLKTAVNEKNKNDILESVERYTKLDDIKNDSYGIKSYLREMSMQNARMMLRIRSKMVQCKMNFSSKKSNIETAWKCHSCMSFAIDTQSHILYCEAYSPLREGKSLSSDKDLVEYFRKVMEIREKLNIVIKHPSKRTISAGCISVFSILPYTQICNQNDENGVQSAS